MISLSAIHKTFNKGEPNEVVALRDVSLALKPSEYLVVIGPNGSGKSTLLNVLAGSVLPSSGEIKIGAQNVTALPEYNRSKWVARIFQDPLKGTAPELSILDNFRLAALRTSAKTLKVGTTNTFKDAVKTQISQLGMGLENKVNQQMGTLSGGQRQALTLLMCVMDEAKILLLDEPTAALDPRSAELVLQTADKLIREHQLTALLITHQLKDAFRFGNRLIFMREGEISKDLDAGEKGRLSEEELYKWFM
ncbi:ABC transporter ATP-binding protein [Hufsiella ginkgonis]|uniref:ATP-binding cassette domain-containing protein n=1 Tax=Hufsiella ginkgonis TaxID=2695274 RepID=A0A7K1Y066_9SPHI|nr:ATP-binding cassette domain-containing protein [Hufsiella ginkgonis]MXV16613.1 ATP-binding cassette domain-containing protein [Hufsiella ginkgonis]